MAAVAAALCLSAFPTGVRAAATASAGPAASGPRLVLAGSVDRTFTSLGHAVTFTITLRNVGSQSASGVTVDDVLGGDAGYLVEDGTPGTVNSFVGWPVVTVSRLVTGHYRWSYRIAGPGTTAVVRFSAVIRQPPVALPPGTAAVSLTNTASAAGVVPVTVRTVAPYPPGGRGPVGGVATGTPATGVSPDLATPALVMLAGLGLILAGMLVRRAQRGLSAGGG